jgi:hypothetical protein
MNNIGDCVYVLHHKRWGKTLVGGRLRSQSWWEKELGNLINSPTVIIPPENLFDGKPIEPLPTPFEIEMGIPDLNYEIFLAAWKRISH